MSDIIRVEVTPNQLQLAPGETALAEISVQNASYLVDAFSLEVRGLAEDWHRLSQEVVPLFPGESGIVTLSLRLPPGNAATAGTYQFSVRVRSRNAPQEETNVPVALVAQPVFALDLALRPEKVTGKVGAYQLRLDNASNTDLTFALTGQDPEGFCRFAFDPAAPVVPPRETREVEVVVTPRRRPIYGRPKTYNLNIVATPDKAPEVRTLYAELAAVARIRWWHIPLALLSLLLLVVLAYSVFWAVALRDSWTYLGGETWDVRVLFDDTLQHGQVYPFQLSLPATSGSDTPAASVAELRLTIDVTWRQDENVAPSVNLILQSPEGRCTRPDNMGRIDAPFHQRLDFADDCRDVAFGETLMDLTNQDAPRPATYNYGDPVARYCVAGRGREDERVIYDGANPKRYPDYAPPPGDHWTLYVVNPHTDETPPREVTVRLKAADESQGPPPGFFFLSGKRRHRDYTVSLEQQPLPNTASEQVSAAADQCGTSWDSQMVFEGKGGQGIEHGTIFVRRLALSRRPDTPAQDLQEMRIDATWEAREGGNVTADRVFIVLRNEAGNCWSTIQGQTAEADPETVEELSIASDVVSCRERLSGQSQWNLINWRTLNPASYQEVQPLVRFCQHPQGTTLFGDSDAIPVAYDASWSANTTQGWTLYLMNPNFIADSPVVTVKLRGDDQWRVDLQDPADPAVGEAPLVPASTCETDGAGAP